MGRRRIHLALLAAIALGVHCGNKGSFNGDGGADAALDSFVPSDGPTEAAPPAPIFPATPLLDGTAPANAPTLFGAPDSGMSSGGPCLAEPEIGTLIPKSWLRPRFRWVAASGENLFELRVHIDGQPNDLLVYSSNSSWTMPAAMWNAISGIVGLQELALTVSVRGAVLNGTQLTSPPALGSNGTMSVAPASANGAIVYWALTGSSTSLLKGFSVGDEVVQDVVQTSQISGAGCIGCHAATADGLNVGITAAPNPSAGAPAFIALRTVTDPTQEPAYLTASAKTMLARQEQYVPTFSPAYDAPGNHFMLSVYNTSPWPAPNQLIWTNLEASSTAQGTGWGVVARAGDPGSVTSPSFSHDGKTIVYSSGSAALGGTSQTAGDGDLYTVPYTGGAGGNATKLAGADSSAWSAVYPVFSPDDLLIAFARMPRGTNMVGSVPSEEVWLTDAAGTSATRIQANDPAACLGVTSPGINNSWPHWSPKSVTVGSKTYYWLIFSSWRNDPTNKVAQLYVTGVVTQGSTVTTYPALYLWMQPATEHNLTPAWDVFDIPPPK